MAEQTIQIGNVTIERTAALAPMAGVGDRAFREVCRSFGAAYTVGEMVSAKGMTYHDRKSAALLVLGEAEHPAAVQLFGDDPQVLAQAAQMAMAYSPDILDLNMGCPAPKIAGNGGGSALMRDLGLAERIVRAVVDAVDIPVTVKFRKGWDDDTPNAVPFAQMCEEAGAAAVCVHGRTRAQMYAFPVDYECIAAVKRAVKIPVIANGGIATAADALAVYERTGADLVMIGQGALGAPWLFRQVQCALRGETPPPEPSVPERMQVMLRQAELAVGYKGEQVAMREMRKHAGWYLRGLRGASAFRRDTGSLTTLDDLRRLAERAAALNPQPR